MRLFVRVLSLVILVAIATPARADSAIRMFTAGSVHEGAVQLPRFTLPLPPGRWILTSANESRNNVNDVNLSLTLAKVDDGILAGWIAISTNIDPGNKWVVSKDCGRKDQLYNVTSAAYAHQQDCRWINHQTFNASSDYKPMIGQSIQDFARSKGLPFPHTMIEQGTRLATSMFYLTVHHFTNPVLFGFAADAPTNWSNSPWHKDLIGADPKRVAVIDALRRELEGRHPLIKSASRM